MNAQSSGKIIPKVTIASRSITISEVFKLIRKQTGKVIWYRNEDINENKKVTVNFKDASLEDVLRYLFQASDISWTYDDEAIILRKKKLSENINTSTTLTDTSLSTIQLITVTGKVTDEKGSPIIGATVVLKGNNLKGTTTNSEGTFMLDGVKANASLVITSVSFLTEEVAVKGRQSLGSVVMKEYVGLLDETQVIAYGTTSRRLNTGTVVSLKADEIEKQPVNNPLYVLQGRVAGVIVTPSSGLPGAPVTVQIRGKNSLSKASEPLYIVDGLPYINTIAPAPLSTAIGALSQGMSPLNFINPNDIESISILKDADATAIYGSRGANGVILITTKKGTVGKSKIGININSGISNVAKKLKMMNTEQYISMRKQALTNDNRISRLENPAFAGTYPDLMLWDQNRYTDWQKVMIGNNAKYTDIQASISGGSTSVQYLVGGNYHRETTVFPGRNADNKAGAHLSITGNSPNDRLKITITTSYLKDKSELPPLDFTYNSLITEPNAPSAYNTDGTVNWALYPSTGLNTTWSTPPYSASLENDYQINTSNLTSSADISFRFGGLTFKTTAGYNEITSESFNGTPITAYAPAYSTLTYLRTANYTNNKIKSYSIEPQINYSKNIGFSKVETLLGFALQGTSTDARYLGLYDFSSDLLLKSQDAAASVRTKSNATSEYKYTAIFGRINYTYKNKIILNASIRRDGSSRFGPGYQFGNFGSIGTAWIFSEEPFLKHNFTPLSFGKLRLSYGTSGNDGIGDYQYLEQYQSTNTQPYQGVIGYQSAGLYNPYYHWETTKKLEFALETGFYDNRIVINVNYFRNRSNNQLINYPTPLMAGYGFLTTNVPALIQNSGFEAIFETTNLKRNKLTWTSSVNFTLNRNKLIKYPDLQNSAFSRSIEGQPFWGYVDVYQSAGVNPKTGLYQFKDKTGNIVSDPNTTEFPKYGKDVRITTSPRFYGGISNTLSIGSFSIDFFIHFVKQIGINPLYQLPFAGPRRNQFAEVFGKQWQSTDDNTEFQKFSTTGLTTIHTYYQNSDKGYTDASFIRLKNISLSYNLKKEVLEKLNISSLRLYLQGQNLYTFTKYKGFDPETQSISVLPPLRTIVIGLQLSL